VQSIFDAIPDEEKFSTLIVSGDGRYWNDVAIHKILPIVAANGVSDVIIG